MNKLVVLTTAVAVPATAFTDMFQAKKAKITKTAAGHVNELRWDLHDAAKDRLAKKNFKTSKKMLELEGATIPEEFTWAKTPEGNSYLTKMLNQHIPQYCGSCWAHGATSAFGDRVKIARKGQSPDINLSVQHILNCGTETAGSCYGGSHLAAYEWIHENGYIAYDTENPYMACSNDSNEGFCGAAKESWECKPVNIAKTCSTFTENGGKCVGLKEDKMPKASIESYGSVDGMEKMKKEIFANGPIACGVDADPIRFYKGGVFDDSSATSQVNHVVSVVGWGSDAPNKYYWIVRNSWGEYWGELGFFGVRAGSNMLGLESECAWAIPAKFTEKNVPCGEDGSGCEADDEKKEETLINFV